MMLKRVSVSHSEIGIRDSSGWHTAFAHTA